MLQKAFGKTVRELRTKAGLSQEELGLESHLDRTFISMLERGVRQPSLSSLFALAEALGIAPSKLIRLTEARVGR